MKKWVVICFFVWFVTPVVAGSCFDDMDINKDGYVSWEEFQIAFPDLKKAAFDAIDINKDGKISREEWENFQKLHEKDVQSEEGKKEIKNIKIPHGFSKDLNASEPNDAIHEKFNMKPLIQPPVKK